MIPRTMFSIEINPVISRMLQSSSKTLPSNYQPNEYDVICGRGKGIYRSVGNMKFHSILLDHLSEYNTLSSKIDKTIFLNKIADLVRSQNDGQTRFVRQVSATVWEELSDDQVRDKIGHAIREIITPKTSKKRKVGDSLLSKFNVIAKPKRSPASSSCRPAIESMTPSPQAVSSSIVSSPDHQQCLKCLSLSAERVRRYDDFRSEDTFPAFHEIPCHRMQELQDAYFDSMELKCSISLEC